MFIYRSTWKLRELHFGSYEEKPMEKLTSLDDSILMKGFRQFDGEDISDLIERYLEAFEEIKDCYPSGNVLVVSHGRAIMCYESN